MRVLIKMGNIVLKLNEKYIKTRKNHIIMIYNPMIGEYVPFSSIKHLIKIQY